MRAVLGLMAVLLLAGCSHTGIGNAYSDYKRTSFEVGVNHCLHNTVLRCQ